MKATKVNNGKGIKVSHRKEKHGLYKGYLVIDENMKQVIDCRIYYPNTTAYCCLWVLRGDAFPSGSGSASGYGYHKQSAAVAEAINKAGYELSEDISGVGDYAIERALLAIAELEGAKGCKVFTIYP